MKVMRRAVRDRLLSALPAPIPAHRTWGICRSSVSPQSDECETHRKTQGKLTRNSSLGTQARDVAGQLVTRDGRASQKRAWVTRVEIVAALLLSRNVKVTPASEYRNPSMPCGGVHMAEFIGVYIAVVVIMYLMVQVGGV